MTRKVLGEYERLSPVRRSARSLEHPAVVVAVGIMLLNDHYLKAAHPSWLTGKVSDFSGLLFFPLLVGLVIAAATRSQHSQQLATLVVGGWFVAVKTSASAAALSERVIAVLTGAPAQIVSDPSDLTALPMLGLAWLIWQGAGSIDMGRRRMLRRRLIIAAAALASMGTSLADHHRVMSLVADTGQVWAGVASEEGSSLGLDSWRSADGGLTWEHAIAPADLFSSDESSGRSGVRCSTSARCYSMTEVWRDDKKTGTDYAVTEDGGLTWSALPPDAPIPDVWRAYSSGDTKQVRDVTCLTGSRDRCFRIFDPLGAETARLEVSTNQGATWGRSWVPSIRIPDSERFAASALVLDPRSANLVVGISRGGVAIRHADGQWSTAAVGQANEYVLLPVFPPSSDWMAGLWAFWIFFVSLILNMLAKASATVPSRAKLMLSAALLLVTGAVAVVLAASTHYPYTITIGPLWLRAALRAGFIVGVPIALTAMVTDFARKHIPAETRSRVWRWPAAGATLVVIIYGFSTIRWV